jgi:hypothetical protein
MILKPAHRDRLSAHLPPTKGHCTPECMLNGSTFQALRAACAKTSLMAD